MLKCSHMRDNKLYVQTCGDFFLVTIACLKENSHPEIRKTYFLPRKWGVDLYTGKYGSCNELRFVNSKKKEEKRAKVYV